MFPTYDFNYSSYQEGCWEEFGVIPRPRWITTEFGGQVRQILVALPFIFINS
jgi:lysosomal Pro-X carboxypeptidase